MSIKLHYSGGIAKFEEACRIANCILSSEKFVALIAARKKPYSLCKPRNLKPATIASLFRSTHLRLTLRHYRRDPNIGGAFDPDHPKIIWVNVNTRRSGCTYAAVLVHECVHALSHHVKQFHFSHGDGGAAANRDTAPYAIQRATREHFCNEAAIVVDDLIPVESGGITAGDVAEPEGTAERPANETVEELAARPSTLSELYSVVNVVDVAEGARLYVNENPTPLVLRKDSSGFRASRTLLEQARAEALRVLVSFQPEEGLVTGVGYAPVELALQPLYTAEKLLPKPAAALTRVIESGKKLEEMTAFIRLQNCEGGKSTIDVCIPFHYKRDGCYARAHKMRSIIEDKFKYHSRKLFSYDSKIPGQEDPEYTLAVRDGTVCIRWWYHVASLVEAKVSGKVQEYVIDPSLSPDPLSTAEWKKLQQAKICSVKARVGVMETRESHVYFPNGQTDNDYSRTNAALKKYNV